MKLFILAALGATLMISDASADQIGVAAYYHNPNHGGLIAAHLTLPFGTHVRVHNESKVAARLKRAGRA